METGLIVKIIAGLVILGIGLRNYIIRVYGEQEDFSDAPFPLKRRGRK